MRLFALPLLLALAGPAAAQLPGPLPALTAVLVAQMPYVPPANPLPIRRRDIASITHGTDLHGSLRWGRWHGALGRPRELDEAARLLARGTKPGDVLELLGRRALR